MKRNTTPISDAISQISFIGNITPAIWYQKIKGKAKKTKHGTISQTADFLAIGILSDIIYWYRNIEVRDEKTGVIIEIKKKFASDKLQKSYQSIADFFGVTKSDATEAVTNLVNLGLIKREYRTLIISGVTHNNVVFLSPVPSEILKLTHSIDIEGVPQLTPPYTSIDIEGVPQLTGTNTETTSKSTTDIIKVSKKPDTLADPIIDLVIDAWNEITGQDIQKTTMMHRKNISARLKENPALTLEDFRLVITGKFKEWNKEPETGRSDTRAWITTNTILGSKFDGYLNSLRMLQKRQIEIDRRAQEDVVPLAEDLMARSGWKP
jgi:uncharacterized phage protein (TIGR02220 family)